MSLQSNLIEKQVVDFLDLEDDYKSKGDLIKQLYCLGIIAKNLEILKESKIPIITIRGEKKNVDTFLMTKLREIVDLESQISKRYIPESDEDALCKNFAPLEFIEGSTECDFWFNTLVGLGDEKKEIKNGLINPLKFPKLYGKLTKGILLYGSGGVGKCLHPETPVIMFDGSVKLAKDILKGDKLMGDDSTPRTVLGICSGRDNMYKIVPSDEYGNSFTANEPHVLTLINKKSLNIIDIPLNEYMKKDRKWKKNHLGIRTGIECEDRKIRLEFLGNVLDSGMASYDRVKRHYEFFTKDKFSAESILFFCRWLGYHSKLTKPDHIEGIAVGELYKVEFGGRNLSDILSKTFQNYVLEDEKNNEDFFCCSHKEADNLFSFDIEPQGEGDYCGFELDDNGRFLLGDFTITHNTALVKAAINELTTESGDSIKVLFYAPTIGQLKGKYFGESEKMIYAMFSCAAAEACKLQKIMPGTSVISVIFLDEMDSLAGDRSDDKFMATTVNALLQVMDGVKVYPNVTLIGATNLPWNLDTAILRRFTTSIYVKLPKIDDIFGLFSFELTKHIKNIVSEKESSALADFCQKLTGGPSAVTKGKGLCIRPNDPEPLWKKPPFSLIMRNLDPIKLRALAQDCEDEMYSNSDIARLFKNVVQQVADQAVANNTFVSYAPISQKRYISTLSFLPQELYGMWEQNPTLFSILVPPDHLKIVLEGEDYFNQAFRPFFNITDPNITEVFIGRIEKDTKTEKIKSYEYIISLTTEFTQKEPSNYSDLSEANSALYEEIKNIFEKNGTEKIDNIGKLPYYRLYEILGDKGMKMLKKLIIPGLVRKEEYFIRGRIDTSEGVSDVSKGFLSRGWSYITGVKDRSKLRKMSEAERLKKVGAFANLAKNADSIITRWGSKEQNNAKVIRTPKESLAGGYSIYYLLSQRVTEVEEPLFSIGFDKLLSEKIVQDVFETSTVNLSEDLDTSEETFELVKFDRIEYYYRKNGTNMPESFAFLRRKYPSTYKKFQKKLEHPPKITKENDIRSAPTTTEIQVVGKKLLGVVKKIRDLPKEKPSTQVLSDINDNMDVLCSEMKDILSPLPAISKQNVNKIKEKMSRELKKYKRFSAEGVKKFEAEFDDIVEHYQEYKSGLNEMNVNTISLNISYEHFKEAQSIVKATSKKTEIKTLDRYAENPSAFEKDKKEKEE